MINLTKESLAQIYNQISPFEFKEKLIELATHYRKPHEKLLDAGRGNPNWIAPLPREAFFVLGQFALLESKRSWQKGSLSGIACSLGIARRFEDFLDTLPRDEVYAFFKSLLTYNKQVLNFSPDAWVFELVDGLLGDNYPYPDRMLTYAEKVVKHYLIKELCQNKCCADDFEVFATEGGSAGMCYLFDSLLQNHLLEKGDKIALMTPIFTPYLEIPLLPQYTFEIVTIHADQVNSLGEPTWQYSQEALNQLNDPQIKAVFIVNPSNPGSAALDRQTKDYLVELVHNNRPDLMIVTDDVYSTFVEGFESLLIDLPYNTLCVYSLSKYFGVTGWRLGAIMLQKNNIFNDLIAQLPPTLLADANSRYQHITPHPEQLGFIDRIVADSRQVALNHTAGLSTPQQIQMTLFCLYTLMDEKDDYKQQAIALCRARKQSLYEGLKLPLSFDPLDASYYAEVNLLKWAEAISPDFSCYLQEHHTLLDILYILAKDHGIIVLRGDAFASSEWALRISLANLYKEDYYKIGEILRQVFHTFALEWQNQHARGEYYV